MEWVIGIIAFLGGVVATGLFYRRNKKHMDKVVDKAKAVVKTEVKKVVGKVKAK